MRDFVLFTIASIVIFMAAYGVTLFPDLYASYFDALFAAMERG